MPTLPESQEAVDKAVAAMLLEIAWLVPQGTDLMKHPIAKKLVDFRDAIVARERHSE